MIFRKVNLIPSSALFSAVLMMLFIWTPAATAQQELKPVSKKLPGEAPSVRFEHLGLQDGLQQGSIHDIIQDNKGYLWIATQDGLHRYNGHEFKVYKTIPFDKTSISSSFIWQIDEAPNGDIWATANAAGLNHMDRTTGKFTTFFHDPEDSTSLSSNEVLGLTTAQNGDVWVGTWDKGLNRLRKGEGGKFERFSHDPGDPNSLTTNELSLIEEGPDGMIWAGSTNGLNRIDPSTGTVKRYLYEEGRSPANDPSGIVIHSYLPPDEPETAWLGTAKGLVRLNLGTGDYERFLIEENDPQHRFNRIQKVVPDPSEPGILWVARRGAGIARFNMSTGEFTRYQHDPRDPSSLAENEVITLFSDHSGTMWAGHYVEGISKFNPGAVNFFHLRHNPENPQSLSYGPVWGMYEDVEKNLWFSTHTSERGGFITKFSRNGEITRYTNDPNNPKSLPPGNYSSFAEDKAGRFWIGSTSGLILMNRETGEFTSYAHVPTGENQFRNWINAVVPTVDSTRLWIGSREGLELFDSSSKTYRQISLSPAGGEAKKVEIKTLHRSGDGFLWASTADGFFQIDKDLNIKLVSRYDQNDNTTISSNNIHSILQREEEPQILWLGTMGAGLNRFDRSTGTATHYLEEDGLSNNVIYGLLEDKEGTLWMSTNRGISNFDPETETFRNYGLDDGLMALEYDEFAYMKDSDGMMYFGSMEGVTAFMPEKLATNQIPPRVVLSGLKIFNKAITPGPESLLKKPLSETSQINLKHNQNEITFDFVALHYGNPEKNSYAYLLEGFDEDWIDAGDKRSATYTNLSPGSYTFKVKAANADGVWSEEEASVQLNVSPPWYQTWWAYLLFAVLLVGLVVAIDRFQRRKIRRKEEERAALREAELRAEAENRRRTEAEHLSKIGQAVTSTLSIPKIIERIYEHVNQLMDAAIFGIGIYNEKKNRLDFPATKEKGQMLPPYSHKLNEENRLAVWCFNSKKEIVIGNTQKETSKYVNKYLPPIKGEDSKSVIYLPLTHQGKTIGVITTQSFSENAYNDYHVQLLRNLATYAAIALDNASAYRKLNSTLSDLKVMQEQLVQQEKLASLGQLTAGIAHEIKNPLNFVNNFSELSVELIDEAQEELARAEAENFDSKEKLAVVSDMLKDIEINLKKIYKHGTRADGIVRSMLQHSRGGSGRMQPTDLNELVKEYVNLSFHGMRAARNPINVEIDLQLDEEIGEVPLIEEDFSRVIVNLCNNAFEAMREKTKSPLVNGEYRPKLSVRTSKNKSGIHIEFRDNGPGIPEDIRNKILQPFFTTKKGTAGTGLGLSITHDIVKSHGGSLSLSSSVVKGTCFTVELPKPKEVELKEGVV